MPAAPGVAVDQLHRLFRVPRFQKLAWTENRPGTASRRQEPGGQQRNVRDLAIGTVGPGGGPSETSTL